MQLTVACYLKSNVMFFDDDTMPLSIINDHVISTDESNHNLEVINLWDFQWKIQP